MTKRAGMFFFAVVSALTYCACASAAIFEVQHLAPGTITPAPKIHLLDSRKKAPYRTASIDHGSELPFLSGKFTLARPEDFLWTAIGEANLFGLQFSPPDTDTALYLVGTEHLVNQKARHPGTVSAPAEGTKPEIWALMLIGAGLIWSQLRRKSRPSPIRFTIP